MGVLDMLFNKFQDPEAQDKEPTSASDQTPDELKLVAFIDDRINDARSTSSRIFQEQVWMTNMAYLMGFSGFVWDGQSRTYKNNDKQVGGGVRGRSRINMILPTCQNRLARLCKAPPKYDTRPESPSTEDKDAARLGVQVIEDVWDKQKINLKRLNLGMVLQQAGYGYGKVSWDDQLGDFMLNPETGEMDFQGDVRFEVKSPMSVYHDPMARNTDEWGWAVEVNVRKLDYFRDRYPRGGLVKEEGAWLLSAQYEMKMNDLNGNGQSSGNTEAQLKNAAIERVYYEKRSKKHPNGRMIITANGILLEDKELPVGKIPLVKFDDIIVGNRFEPEALITHLRPIQDRKNKLLMKRDKYVDKVLAGKLIAARGHGLSAEAGDDQTGEIMEYDSIPGGAEPHALQMPAIPSYAYEEDQKIDQQFDFVSGINEVSRGTLPSAQIPAAGMAILQEQDQTRIGVVTTQHEMAWAEVGHLILCYVEKNYVFPRMLKLAGEGLEYTVKKFIGADIKGNKDVFVVPGSSDPGSKTLKRQDILNAFNMGLLGNPQDPKLREKVLKMLEYGDVNEVWQDQAIDMAQINKQIHQIEEGQIPDQNEFDNHPLHFSEKNRYRKTEKYASLPESAQAVLCADIEYHVQQIVALTQPGVPQETEMADELVKSGPQLGPNGQAQPHPNEPPHPAAVPGGPPMPGQPHTMPSGTVLPPHLHIPTGAPPQ